MVTILCLEHLLKLNFVARYDDLSCISASTFELPAPLSRRLKSISDQIYNGIGFQIIHGLDPSKYTQRQNLIVYAGVGAHIFPQRGFVDQAGEEVIGTCIVNFKDTVGILRVTCFCQQLIL